MAHIEQGDLQAYLDDEVGARAEIDAHVHSCAECAAELGRLREASTLFASAMHGMDTQAPVFSALAELKHSNGAAAVAPKRQPARVPLVRVPLARAALLLFGFAAAASATIPGSPVRAWLGDALRTVGVLGEK